MELGPPRAGESVTQCRAKEPCICDKLEAWKKGQPMIVLPKPAVTTLAAPGQGIVVARYAKCAFPCFCGANWLFGQSSWIRVLDDALWNDLWATDGHPTREVCVFKREKDKHAGLWFHETLASQEIGGLIPI